MSRFTVVKMILLLYDLNVVKYDEKADVIMRGINAEFIDALNSGVLKVFLDHVKLNRDKLCLEIREDYINIYYRGGNLLRIKQHKNKKTYSCFFDTKYCHNKKNYGNYEKLNNFKPSSINDFIDSFPVMMMEMDAWIDDHPKEERKFQHQLLVNNSKIIDIEYATPKENFEKDPMDMRLDMLVVEDNNLYIIENKYGIGSLSGNAGVEKHYRDIVCLLEDNGAYNSMVESLINISRNKYALGLIDKPIDKIDKSKTEIIFLLADVKRKDIWKEKKPEMNMMYKYKVLFMDKDEYVIDLSKAE